LIAPPAGCDVGVPQTEAFHLRFRNASASRHAWRLQKIIHQKIGVDSMKKLVIMPVLAAMLVVAACGDSDPTDVATPARVRYFNVVWNAPDGIGFTTNNQFATGSALKYGESTQTCSTLNGGNTTFGIGIANAGGTALNGPTIVTLNNQTITDGGNYTVLAGGNVIHPSVVLLDNRLSGTLGTNQAAVRFVNLAASSEFPFDVLQGTTMVQTNLAFRGATPFNTVTSGSNAYTIRADNQTVISGNDAMLNLQAGTVNTVVIVRDVATNNFRLINVPSCS
jgi:hypothetical protein